MKAKKINDSGHIYFRNDCGDLHNEEGPALIWNKSKTKWYYLNGKNYTKSEWEREVFRIRLERLKDL